MSLNRPLVPALIALAGTALFVVLRLASVGGASRFVVAGDTLSDPLRVPAGLPVLRSSSGYDGQAFYRLALDPFTRVRSAYGITLDTPPYRQQRIGYPLTAWAISGGGDPRALPWVLIGINIAAMAAIGFIGALLARAFDRHAMWGLIFVAHPGFVVSVARDLSEPMAAAWMLAGLLLLRRSRSTGAALALTAAVLTRETTAIVPIGLAVSWLIQRVGSRRERRPAREFLIPLAAFAAWETILTAWWGQVPFTSNRNATQAPLVGLVRHIRSVFAHPTADSVTSLFEIAFFIGIVVVACAILRSENVRSYERWAFMAALVSAALLSANVWFDHAHFLRALTEVYLLGATIILAGWTSELNVFGAATGAFVGSVAAIFARKL